VPKAGVVAASGGNHGAAVAQRYIKESTLVSDDDIRAAL
jgi:threonine dehydratase